MSIKIVVDSISDMPSELIAKYGMVDRLLVAT